MSTMGTYRQRAPAEGTGFVGPLLVVQAALLWATTGVAVQLLPTVPASTIGGLRLVLGAFLLRAICGLARCEHVRWRTVPGQGRMLAITGGCCCALFQLSFFSAVRIAGAASGVLVALGTAPVAAAGIDWLFRRRVPTGRWYLGTVLAIAGVMVLSLRVGGPSPLLGGLVLAAAAGACYAAYSSCAQALVHRGLPHLWVVRTTLAIGAAGISPELLGADCSALSSPTAVAVILWLALPGTALAYLAHVAGLGRTSGPVATTLGLVQPVAAAVLAIVVLGEAVRPALMVSAALLLAGLVVVSWPDRKGPGHRPARPARRSTPVPAVPVSTRHIVSVHSSEVPHARHPPRRQSPHHHAQRRHDNLRVADPGQPHIGGMALRHDPRCLRTRSQLRCRAGVDRARGRRHHRTRR